MNTPALSAVSASPACPVIAVSNPLLERLRLDLQAFEAERSDVDAQLAELELRRQELLERRSRAQLLREYAAQLLKDTPESEPPVEERQLASGSVTLGSNRKRSVSPKSLEALERVNARRRERTTAAAGEVPNGEAPKA